MADDPEAAAPVPAQPAERARWLADVREALNRASALVDDARATGRDTTEIEERIAVALALIEAFEAGAETAPGNGREGQ